MTLRFIPVCAVALCLAVSAHAETSALQYAPTLQGMAAGSVVVDSRPAALCEAETVANAHCLDASAFLGPHDRLASFADIAWVLGSAGLDGSEVISVVGNDPQRRDFVAGLLYLMGQKHVIAITRGLKDLNGDRGPGIPRANTRAVVWKAPARADAVVYKRDLASLLAAPQPPRMLDGRDEKAYWGAHLDGARGGHLPGADHLPALQLRGDVARGDAIAPAGDNAISYAHHAVDGIAYMTLLIAGTGAPVRVFPDGWAAWAADGSLPIDAASYPVSESHQTVPPPPTDWRSAIGFGLIGILLGIGMTALSLKALRRGKAV